MMSSIIQQRLSAQSSASLVSDGPCSFTSIDSENGNASTNNHTNHSNLLTNVNNHFNQRINNHLNCSSCDHCHFHQYHQSQQSQQQKQPQPQQQPPYCHHILSSLFGVSSSVSVSSDSSLLNKYNYNQHSNTNNHIHHLKSGTECVAGNGQRNYCKLIFKITIVLLSFAGFLYQAADICAHYFSYRTVVYTNTEQDSLVDLPSITFCLPTYFTKQSLEQLYSPYIKRNLEEMSAFKNQSMLDAIKPVIYETFQKQAFKDLSAAQILERSISDDGIIECRLFYPPQHWPNLTRERMYEIVQYGLPCEEVTQVISSINANGKCFTFFSQLLTDNDSLRAYQQGNEQHQILEYQQYPQMTSFASSSASSASTRSTGPVAPPIVQHSRYVPVSHKISVNHGYRFHSGRFIRLQIQFNRNQYTVISDGHQRECIQVHPPFKIPSEACIHSINPGMSYDFVLTKTKAILQPPPYQTNCQSYQAVTQAESELLASSSDPNELKEFYLKPMSRSDCIDKCMIHIYEKYCGCLPIHISIWQRSSSFLNMSVCDYEDFERISPCLEKELGSTCYDTCKSDCIDRHYHLHVESRIYPSDEHIKQATGVERIRLKRLRQNAATISIWSNYLSDITYVHTPAMSLIQLICYLGGLAGLWLGVSVMTVSGWLAQLYPFMQKWNYKQRYILLTARQNIRYFYDSFRYRQSDDDLKLPDYQTASSLSQHGAAHGIPVDVCCYSANSKTCCLYEPPPPLHGHPSGCYSDDSGCFDMLLNEHKLLDRKTLSTESSDSGEHNPSMGELLSKSNESEMDAILSLDPDIEQEQQQKPMQPQSSNQMSLPSQFHQQLKKSPQIRRLESEAKMLQNSRNGNKKLYHRSHPHTVARRAVYWSNYSSMSTSSDDLSLISSSTNSTNVSISGNNSNSGNNASIILRRLSLMNGTTNNMPDTGNSLGKYSNQV